MAAALRPATTRPWGLIGGSLASRARAILQPNLERLTEFVDKHDDLEWIKPTGGNVALPKISGIDNVADFA